MQQEAAAKGLVAGYCSLLTKSGETMDVQLPAKVYRSEGYSAPRVKRSQLIRIGLSGAKFTR